VLRHARPRAGRPAGGTARIDAGSKAANAVTELWCAALGVEPEDAGDDFFTLGGDSLAAAQLLARLRDRLGIRVRLAAFFAQPTIDGLSALVDAALAAGRAPAALQPQADGVRETIEI
jgi:dihydroaeruginoic acid synthetase